MKRQTKSLVIKELKIKATKIYYYTPTQILRRRDWPSAGMYMDQWEFSFILSEIVKLNTHVHFILGMYSRWINAYVQKSLEKECSFVLIAQN